MGTLWQVHDEQAGFRDVFRLQRGAAGFSTDRRWSAIKQGGVRHAGQK